MGPQPFCNKAGAGAPGSVRPAHGVLALGGGRAYSHTACPFYGFKAASVPSRHILASPPPRCSQMTLMTYARRLRRGGGPKAAPRPNSSAPAELRHALQRRPRRRSGRQRGRRRRREGRRRLRRWRRMRGWLQQRRRGRKQRRRRASPLGPAAACGVPRHILASPPPRCSQMTLMTYARRLRRGGGPKGTARQRHGWRETGPGERDSAGGAAAASHGCDHLTERRSFSHKRGDERATGQRRLGRRLKGAQRNELRAVVTTEATERENGSMPKRGGLPPQRLETPS